MVIKIVLLALPLVVGVTGFLRWWFGKEGDLFDMGVGANVVSLVLGILLFFFGSIASPWSLVGSICDFAFSISALICYFDKSHNYDATDGRF